MASAKTNKTISTIFAIIVLVVTIGLVVYFAFFKDSGYTPLDEIDLNTYSLEEIKVEDKYILNDPSEINGSLIFKNSEGDTLKAKLSEAKISGFSTKTVGSWQMKVIVGDEERTVDYTVTYKEIFYNNNSPISLSISDPIELDYIYVNCTDYNDNVVKSVPLSDIFSAEDFDVDYVTDYEQNASTTFLGYDINVIYTVGYIGYKNYYRGETIKVDSGTQYQLSYFTMSVNENGESGDGSFQIIYDDGSLLDATTENFSFTWQKDYLSDVIDITLLNGTSATYNYLSHQLTLGADVMNTINPLTFTLRLDV